jgi:OOP family OmpA-OmpF porin
LLLVGWGFGNGLRAEVEGNYRQNDIDKVGGFPGYGVRGSALGIQRTYGAMANLLYDFRIPGVPWVVPYVGGGVGYAWREWDGMATRANNGARSGLAGDRGQLRLPGHRRLRLPDRAGARPRRHAEYRYFAPTTPT